MHNAECTKIVGVGFTPDADFSGAATATLTGGPDGAKAEDGRTIGGNYVWAFTWTFDFVEQVEFDGIFMPLLFK